MDVGWDMFLTVPEMVKKLSENQHEYYILQKFLAFCELAKTAAGKANVTGGYSTDIYAMPLINKIYPSKALIWKAGRGGWCIAVSEKELPWIEAIEGCTVSVVKDL